MQTPVPPPPAVVPHVGGPILPPGHPMTMIGGMPAARVGDMLFCAPPAPPDSIVKGSGTVMIGGMPAARMGDQTAHGGVIVAGCPTVLIGDSGSGGGSAAAGSMKAAKASAKPFAIAGHPPAPPEKVAPPRPDPLKTSWIEVSLVDEAGTPVPWQRYRIVGPDGSVHIGVLGKDGTARIEGLDPGSCTITFPGLDQDAWRPA